MRLSLIPPLSLLTWASNTNYHLMLPQLTSNFWYNSLYTFRGMDPEQYIILDNGAAEGCTTPPVDLITIAERYTVDEVVLPDVLGDTLGTSIAVREFMKELEGRKHDYKLGLVCTGRSRWEAFDFAQGMLDQWPEKIDVLYLPRLLVKENDKFARLDLAADLHEVFPDIEMHFLGANSKFIEEMKYAGELGFLRGMDTSAPYNYAFAGQTLDGGQEVNRPEGYFYQESQRFTRSLSIASASTLQYNIDLALKWAAGE